MARSEPQAKGVASRTTPFAGGSERATLRTAEGRLGPLSRLAQQPGAADGGPVAGGQPEPGEGRGRRQTTPFAGGSERATLRTAEGRLGPLSRLAQQPGAADGGPVAGGGTLEPQAKGVAGGRTTPFAGGSERATLRTAEGRLGPRSG